MATILDLTTLNLPEGTHTITVKAKGNKLKSSVASAGVSYTIEPLMPTVPTPSIALDGNTLKIYDESGVCESFDILVDGEVKQVVNVESLISFTISELGYAVEYQAERGMTWGEWCDSDYDISPTAPDESYVVSDYYNGVCKKDGDIELNWVVHNSDGTDVSPTDVIKAGAVYEAYANGGTND